MVDQMLWLSLRGIINNFRENVLGLDPIRASDGGWNMVNSHRVPFVKLWSHAIVPMPKDYPDYVDISGTFSDMLINPSIVSDTKSESASRSTSQDVPMLLPLEKIADDNLAYFLSSSDRKPIFVGFGSMVIEDAESVIRDFLDAAALVGVRIIIQTGWSEITSERFSQIALEAQMKAALVRDTEERNSQSIIFPSPRPPESFQGRNAKTSTTTRDVMDNLLASVESNKSEEVILKANEPKRIPETFLDEAVDEDEDYVTISTDDNLIHHDEYDELYSSGSKSTSLSIQITRQISGQVRRWFYGPQDAITSPITSIAKPIAEPVPEVRESESVKLTPQKKEEKEWDDIPELSSWKSSDACLIGPCPHSLLFQHVAAAIHHGGAGTTSASLQAGLPTWICPFFGDQNFWGEIVYRRGLGPRPCPVQELTLSRIADSMLILLNDETKAKAKAIAEILSTEDGVTGAATAFYKHLPVDCMICDVSIFLGESRLADVFCQDCNFKLSSEISNCIHWGEKNFHRIQPLKYVGWESEAPSTSTDGIIQGITGLVHEVADGVGDVIYQPVRGIYTDGLQAVPGAAAGVVKGLVKGLIAQPLSRVGARFRNKSSSSEIDGYNSSSAGADGQSSTLAPYILHRRAEGYGRNLENARCENVQSSHFISTCIHVDKNKLDDLIFCSLSEENPKHVHVEPSDIPSTPSCELDRIESVRYKEPNDMSTENLITAHLDPAVVENDCNQLQENLSGSAGEASATGKSHELSHEQIWEHRQQSIIEAYASAQKIQQVIVSISKGNGRSLSLEEFQVLIERAISRTDIVTSANDFEMVADSRQDENDASDMTNLKARKNDAYVARKIAEVCSDLTATYAVIF